MPTRNSSTVGTIDGAVTPDLIPDSTAYSTLFRFISNRPEDEKARIRAYLQMLNLSTACRSCPHDLSQGGQVQNS